MKLLTLAISLPLLCPTPSLPPYLDDKLLKMNILNKITKSQATPRQEPRRLVDRPPKWPLAPQIPAVPGGQDTLRRGPHRASRRQDLGPGGPRRRGLVPGLPRHEAERSPPRPREEALGAHDSEGEYTRSSTSLHPAGPRVVVRAISLFLLKRSYRSIIQADAENRPVYLESSSLANNAYYKRFGFEVRKDVILERGDTPVRLSLMVREPRSDHKVAYPTPTQVLGLGSGKKALEG